MSRSFEAAPAFADYNYVMTDRIQLRPVERHYQFVLLGLVTSGFLALATGGLLDLPTVILTAIALAARLLMVFGVLRWTPHERFEARAGFCYLVFYPIDWYFLSQDAINATVHLLLFLGTLRLFTAQTPRDYRFVQTLALLQMLAATLSASSYFLVFLGSFLIFGIGTLASSEILRNGSRSKSMVVVGRDGLTYFGWRSSGLILFISFMVVLVASGLFFILPRSAHAAFQHFAPVRDPLPGLSDVVSLGAIGEIQQSDSPLLHVRMLSQVKPPNLKWRGMVLTNFDGHRWTQGDTALPAIPVERGYAKLGTRPTRVPWFQYEVRMRDLDSDVLFFAGRPWMAGLGSREIYGSPDTGYRMAQRQGGLVQYAGFSVLEDPAAAPSNSGAVLEPHRRQIYLKLPQTDPRLKELAATWTSGKPGAIEEARAIEYHLSNDFAYTLELPKQAPADPLAHFLFERRRGHCEYFASSMAVLLRLRGIPSRVVTGFQSGVMNPINGWLILRSSDAHSWVEAWVEGKGWITFDPTPAAGINATKSRPQWLQQARFYLDAFEVFWGDWVVSYDFERQLRLAADFHDAGRRANGGWLDRMASAATWLNSELPRIFARWRTQTGLWIIGAGMVLAAAWLLWRTLSGRGRLLRYRSGGAGKADATLLYQRMLKTMRRRGIEKQPWTTADEFAAAPVVAGSEDASLVVAITDSYNQLRFGHNPQAAARLHELVSELERRN